MGPCLNHRDMEVEDNWRRSLLSFHHVGHRYQTQSVGFGSKNMVVIIFIVTTIITIINYYLEIHTPGVNLSFWCC